MQKVVWHLIVAYIVLLIIREAVWFVSDNFTIIALILGVSIILYSIVVTQNAKAAAAKAEEERKLNAQILRTNRGDFIRGYKITKEIGWVSVKDCDSSQEAEEQLRVAAAKLGANGVIKLHWRLRKESYVAGHGKKGNPYYKNCNVYDGEGVAVQISKSERNKMISRTTVKPTSAAGYTSGWIAIDGNNLFSEIFKQTDDAVLSFQIFRKYLVKINNSPYKFHIFWDGKFIKFAHALKIEPMNKKLEDILMANLGISSSNLTVSEVRQRVDDLIVPWAHLKTCAILSNDNYAKDYEDKLIITKSNELKDYNLLLKFKFIAGEIVVPELTAL
jgi:hypothetical protein